MQKIGSLTDRHKKKQVALRPRKPGSSPPWPLKHKWDFETFTLSEPILPYRIVYWGEKLKEGVHWMPFELLKSSI